MRAQTYFAYLLRCGDRSFYAGVTVDPVRRLAAHRQGIASRYTRSRGPVRLAAVWRCPTRRAAQRLEWLLKQVPHAAKRRLARGAALVRIVPKAAPLGARRLDVRLLNGAGPARMIADHAASRQRAFASNREQRGGMGPPAKIVMLQYTISAPHKRHVAAEWGAEKR